MNNYVSPVIFDNDELAEGVYATGSGASGNGCWTISLQYNKSDSTTTNPGWNKASYELEAKHGNVEHISLSTTINIDLFPGTPGEKVDRVEVAGVSAYPDGTWYESVYDHLYENGKDLGPRFKIKVSQSELVIVRRCHGNAYAFADVTDTFTLNPKVYCTNGTYTMTYRSHECEKTANVQGRGGNE